MPTLRLPHSPHAPGHSSIRMHYREFGKGRPLIFLHGGWGYGVYPFDRQIQALEGQLRILIPDRSGYGHSTRVNEPMPVDFHRRAAAETRAFLDALDIEKALFWGHSDGAVIAAMIGLESPQRCECLILEAFHFLRRKPRSRAFFERFAAHPEELGEETKTLLAKDHGKDHWQMAVGRNTEAWLRIANQASRPDEDLYEGKLAELSVRTLFLHGRLDPRTEPGEMERVQRELPHATVHFVENGRHSPHSEEAAYAECNAVAGRFLLSDSK